MKKKLSLLLALIACFTLLVSCTETAPTPAQNNNVQQDPAPAPAVQNDAPEKNVPVEEKILQIYTWEASLKKQNDAVVAAFEAKNPGVKVQINYPVENDNTAYTQKMDLLLISDVVIDAMLESSVARCVDKVNRGLYLPLNEYLDAEGVKYDDIYSVDSSIDGKYYATPIDISPWFVMINKAMLDAAGLPIPPLNWTWDDYRDYAKKLTKGSGVDKVYGSYFHTWQNYDLMGVYSTKMDNAYYKADGSLNFDDPNLRDWLQYRYDIENVDQTSVTLMDIKTSKLAYRNEYYAQKVAMVPTGAWMLAEIKDLEKWPHDFQTVFAPLPKWKNGQEGRTFSDTKMFSITKSAKYPKEAYDFIRFYTTEGAYIRAGGLTAEKDMDVETVIKAIVGDNPDALYNMDSLYAVFKNPLMQYNAPMIAPPYNAEIDTMFVEECEKYLVGGGTLDQCIEALKTRGADIVRKSGA